MGIHKHQGCRTPCPKKVAGPPPGPKTLASEAVVEGTPSGCNLVEWHAVASIANILGNPTTICEDTFFETGLHLVGTLVVETVHHPAPQLDVEKNDHVADGLN